MTFFKGIREKCSDYLWLSCKRPILDSDLALGISQCIGILWGVDTTLCMCVFFCLQLAFWGHWWITGQDVLMWKGLLPLLMLRCILITGVPLYQGFLFWCMMGICCLRLYMVGFSYMAFVTGSVLWTICKHKKNPDSIFESGVCFTFTWTLIILVNKWLWECF